MEQSSTSSTASTTLSTWREIILVTAAALTVRGISFYLLGGAKLIWDSHWYLALAKNFWQGSGYSLGDGIFHSKYPPGFPVLIALVHSLSGLSWAAAGAILSVGTSAATIVLTYFAGKRAGGRFCGLLSAALLGIHHLAIVHTSLILTESVFTALVMGTLLLLGPSTTNSRQYLASATVAALAALVRYEGLLLFPVILLEFIRSRKNRPPPRPRAALVVLVVITALAWFTWGLALYLHRGASDSGYLGELRQWEFLRLVDFLSLGFWLGPLYLLLSVVPLFCTPRESRLSANGLFALLYLGLHCVWWFSDIRFFLPLVPLLAIAAARGLLLVKRYMPRPMLRRALVLVLLCAAATEQWSLMHPHEDEYRRYNVLYLHQYDPIARLSAELRELHPQTVIVPETTVYRYYLPDTTILSYEQALNSPPSFGTPAFLIIDNIHFEDPRINALKGEQVAQKFASQTADDTHFAAAFSVANSTGR